MRLLDRALLRISSLPRAWCLDASPSSPLVHVHVLPRSRADIDAAFRVIAEHFYQLGMILTVDDFMAQLRAAWSGGKHDKNSIVEPVDVVFDYKAWFDGAVYDVVEPTLVRADTHAQVKGITSARYFLIRKRADGNVCFWYKPQPAHPWLYPTKKDASGEPMYTVKDGERCYDIPCPDGIEIFHREFARGPSEAAPKHAMFPEGLLDVGRSLACASLRALALSYTSSTRCHAYTVGQRLYDGDPRDSFEDPSYDWHVVPAAMGAAALYLPYHPRHGAAGDASCMADAPIAGPGHRDAQAHLGEAEGVQRDDSLHKSHRRCVRSAARARAHVSSHSMRACLVPGQILRNAQVQTNLDEQQQDALAQKVEVGDKVLIQPDWTDVDEETKKVVASVRLQLACGTDLSFAVAQAMDTPLWLAKITDASDKDVVNVAWYLTFANRDPKPRMDGKWSLACKCQPFHKFDILVCGRRRNHGLWVNTVSPHPLYNPSDSCTIPLTAAALAQVDRASIKAVDVCLTQEGKLCAARSHRSAQPCPTRSPILTCPTHSQYKGGDLWRRRASRRSRRAACLEASIGGGQSECAC